MGTSGYKPVGTPAEQAEAAAELQRQLHERMTVFLQPLRGPVCFICGQDTPNVVCINKLDGDVYRPAHVECIK